MNKIFNNGEINISNLFAKLNANKSEFLKLFSIGLIFILVIYIFSDRLYTSSSSISPKGNSSNENTVSSVIAGSLGIGENIQIDPTVIFYSEALKKSIIYKKRDTEKLKNINLIEFWDLERPKLYNPIDLFNFFLGSLGDENTAVKNRLLEFKALKMLDKRLTLTEDFYTNEIVITSTMEERLLAQQINKEIIDYINQFITNSKNQNASSEIYFLNKRIKEVDVDLIRSENELQVFKEENTDFINSPRLFKEYSRLLRNVELNSTILIQLKSQVELKKITELSEVPNFVIVDESTFPTKKVWPRLSRLLIGLVLISFVITFLQILVNDFQSKIRNKT
tara:strand:+ start:3741 stop:4751 length:1011 start_codon:yes stop_codon:yes gene_type:complete